MLVKMPDSSQGYDLGAETERSSEQMGPSLDAIHAAMMVGSTSRFIARHANLDDRRSSASAEKTNYPWRIVRRTIISL